MKTFKSLREDIGGITASLGNVTGPAVVGTGDDAQAFPRGKSVKKYKITARAKPNEVGSSSAMKEIPIQEEEATNAASGIPWLGDNPNKDAWPTKTKKNKPIWPMFRRLPLNLHEEVKTGVFAGEQTFIVPSHVFEKAMHEKRKGKHWRTYIQDEVFHPAIREFAYKNKKKPIIFEDEKTGYMTYARYSRKKH